MRRHTVRKLQSIQGGMPAHRESEAAKVTRLTREIVEETGVHAPALLGLIEHRSAGITRSKAADFVIREWRQGGAAQARLLDLAAKDEDALKAERALSKEIAIALKPVAGQAWGPDAIAPIRAKLSSYLRVQQMKFRIPASVPLTEIDRAVAEAIDITDSRLSIRMSPLSKLFLATG